MARKLGLLKHEPRLTWAHVNAIRREYRWHSREAGGAALAKKFGVSANTIHKIVHGKIWQLRAGDGNAPLPKFDRLNWKAVVLYEQKMEGHFDTLMRLLS